MRELVTLVFSQIGLDINSPMEDAIGGIYSDLASEIRYYEGSIQKAEIAKKITDAARNIVQDAVDNQTDLIKYILMTATKDLLEKESICEKFFIGRTPTTFPYSEIENLARILGHAADSIVDGVVGNLAEAGLYRPIRTFYLA